MNHYFAIASHNTGKLNVEKPELSFKEIPAPSTVSNLFHGIRIGLSATEVYLGNNVQKRLPYSSVLRLTLFRQSNLLAVFMVKVML